MVRATCEGDVGEDHGSGGRVDGYEKVGGVGGAVSEGVGRGAFRGGGDVKG